MPSQWNELRKFTLDLNEKLYKPIFAKRIRPKYLQNVQMVLSMLCNDDKYAKKVPKFFWYNYIPKSYYFIHFFFDQRAAEILRKLPSFSASYQRFLICWTVLEYFAKTENRPVAPWDRIASVIWHCYVLNILISTE